MSFDEDSILAREAQLIFSNVNGFTMGDNLRIWRGKIKAGSPNNREYEFEFTFPAGFPNQRPILKAISTIFHPNVTHDGFIQLDILDRWRPEFHGYQVLLQLKSLLRRSPPQKEPAYSNSIKSRDTAYIPSGNKPPVNESYQTQRNTPKFENFRKNTLDKNEVTVTRNSTSGDQQDASEVALLKKQMSTMRDQITNQEEELTRIRARNAIGIGSDSKSQPKNSKESFEHLKSEDQIAELESEQIAISELMAGLHEKHQSGEISIFDYSKLYKKYSRDLFILRKKLEYVQSKQN